MKINLTTDKVLRMFAVSLTTILNLQLTITVRNLKNWTQFCFHASAWKTIRTSVEIVQYIEKRSMH